MFLGVLETIVSLKTLSAAGLLLVVVSLGHTIYNVFFHPLSDVPGPLFARMSGIPSWYHALKRDRHIWLWQMFQVYGDRVRPAPNTVLFCDPEAYKDIYSSKANVQRSDFYTAWRRNKADVHTLNTVDVAEHAHKRKLLNVSFTEKSMRATSKFVFRHIDRWNDLFVSGDDWSEPIDFSERVDKLFFDVSGDLCFGKSFETIEPGKNSLKDIPHTIGESMKFYYPIARSPFLSVVLWLKPRGLDALLEAIAPPAFNLFHKFIRDSVDARIVLQEQLREKPEAEQRLDMFHFLCEAKDPETGLPAHTEDSLRAEASLLVIAGSSTSATSLTAAVFYLTLPSQTQRLAKVISEVRTTFASADDIVHGPQLSSCTYLEACIEEAMRLCPAGPSELPRVVRRGGTTIKSHHYPEGITVGTSGYTNGRNAQIYGDCDAYRPERWIVGDGVTADDVARARSNFHPFSSGPGNCVGQNLAMLELRATLARTLWRFDVRRVEGEGATLGACRPEMGWGQNDPDHFQLVDAYIALHTGPMVQFRRRRT